jgi:hypothetical protein
VYFLTASDVFVLIFILLFTEVAYICSFLSPITAFQAYILAENISTFYQELMAIRQQA